MSGIKKYIVSELTIFFLVYCFPLFLPAQNSSPQLTERANQTVFFEALGNGLIYSVNYDHLIFKGEQNNFSFRTGLSLYPVSGTTDFPNFVVPIEFNYLAGHEKMFEMGLGVSFLNYGNNMWPSLRLGYRKQKVEGGYFFRFGFLLALINYDDDDMTNKQVVPTLGLGFGYTIPKKYN